MAFDIRDYRNALSRFTTGIAVVAARSDDSAAGITVNSFTSISLEPPLIAWSLGKESARYDLFSSTGLFSVNVLSFGQEMLAKQMASSSLLDSAAPWTPGEEGAPLIPGCASRFVCETHERVEAGDHLIILGRVIAFDHSEEGALAYYRSRYGRADSI